jgi:hypothetical protein
MFLSVSECWPPCGCVSQSRSIISTCVSLYLSLSTLSFPLSLYLRVTSMWLCISIYRCIISIWFSLYLSLSPLSFSLSLYLSGWPLRRLIISICISLYLVPPAPIHQEVAGSVTSALIESLPSTPISHFLLQLMYIHC